MRAGPFREFILPGEPLEARFRDKALCSWHEARRAVPAIDAAEGHTAALRGDGATIKVSSYRQERDAKQSRSSSEMLAPGAPWQLWGKRCRKMSVARMTILGRRERKPRSALSGPFALPSNGSNPAQTVVMRLNLRVAFLAAIAWLHPR